MTGILSLSKFLSKKSKSVGCPHDVIVIDKIMRVVICEKCLEELDPLDMLIRCGGFCDNLQGESVVHSKSDGGKGGAATCATVHYLRPKV